MSPHRAKPPLVCPPKARLLRYRNQRVIDKFLEQYRLERREAEQLFEDMLLFLWLASRSLTGPRGTPLLGVLEPHALMDEMWHTFILHTREYERFCRRFFGRTIHHDPTAPPERVRGADGAREHAELRRKIAFVYDELGEDVARRWFDAYVDRYTDVFVDARRVTRAQASRRARRAVRGGSPAREPVRARASR